MVRRVLALLTALPLSAALTRPEGCSEYRWTGVCAGFSITCESLAIAGLICGDQSGGVGRHGECEEACAEPCCISTTTTTQTMTTSTATATTATSTSSTKTATATSTATRTTTSQTVTVTGSTVTRTATTSATTSSLTGTKTSSTATTSTATMTTATETTATMTTATETTETTTAGPESEGPFRRLVVRIKVTGVQDETRYVTDSRVSTAYREAMEEVTGLGNEKVDLQMVVTAPGNLTVSYILTVPEAHASSSMEEVKQSLMKETASSFSAKLQEHIDALVGHGHYTQQVVSMESAEDGAIGVSATERQRPWMSASLWIACAMLAVTAWLSEIF